jgi:hypothetical protein
MITEKSAARAAQGESLTSPTAASSSSKRASTGSAGGDNEKLQQSYKRVRKELAAAVMSKDQAKLKQEVRFDSLSANIKQLTSSLTNLLSLLRI